MKFNVSNKGINKVTNYEGAPAYKMSNEMHLYSAVVTAALSNKYYESAEERLETLRLLIAKCDPEFTARLAVYARENMNLRSVPLVLAVELAKVHSGDSLVSRLTERVVQRADEITEILAYYQAANKRDGIKKLKGISKQIQKGLQGSFNKFDEYQFAKYNRDTEIKLRDALFIVHPKAKNDAQQSVFNKITENKLSVPYTWETELSALGQQKFGSLEERKHAFRIKWEELINSGKLGYMALMRNMRNILEAGVTWENLRIVCKTLSSEQAVLRSKQFPFRFLAAYRELSKINSGHAAMLMEALEDAVTVSARNIAGFDEKTSVLVACDVSVSMQTPISPKSAIKAYDIGLMLGMLLKSRCANVISGIFGDKWKIVNLPGKNILNNVDAFYKRANEVGYATNGYLVIKSLIDNNTKVDKIMMFTDCQMWNNKGKETIQETGTSIKKYHPIQNCICSTWQVMGNRR